MQLEEGAILNGSVTMGEASATNTRSLKSASDPQDPPKPKIVGDS
jgi:hypothetical protein